MNLTFRQRTHRPGKSGRCAIFLDVTWAGQRLPLPTGVSCLPADFQPTKRQLISGRDLDSGRLNALLQATEKAVTSLFTLAAATEQPVMAEQLKAAVASLPGGRTRKAVTTAEPEAPPATFALLYARWQAEHRGQGPDAARRYQQVLGHLEAFHSGFTLAMLTKPVYFDYLAYLQQLGLSDGTITNHVKFLRACYVLQEAAPPTWLKFSAKYGRAAALRREELAAIWHLSELPEPLQRERERLLFQTLLLLRDSDLRRLRPHHVAEEEVAGLGRVLVLRMYQTKTNEAVAFPLPPPAAAIWASWQGVVPVLSQQRRNLHIKELAQAAGLTRPHVRVRFQGGRPVEQPLALHEVISTHTPRHTGADLVLWGSDGDTNLKELALGHTVGLSAYGYDSLDRYAPLLLRAWAKVWAAFPLAHTFADSSQTDATVCAPVPAGLSPVAVRCRS